MALTGSFGSGKSTVAALFAQGGAAVIDADDVARSAVTKGSAGLEAVVSAFGSDVVDASGNLDRKKVGEIVFEDRKALEKLNSIVHPIVRQRMQEFVEGHPEEDLVVLEIPLFLESENRMEADVVTVVRAGERARFGRLRRAGFSEREIIARLGAQMSQARKVKMADHVIDNDGDLASLETQVNRLMAKYRKAK